MRLLLTWLINTVAIFALPHLLDSVAVDSFTTALFAALVLGLVNTLIRPILVVLTLPVTLLTLGLFIFVINGLMFWLASRLLDDFHVTSFGWAVLAALVYSLISWAVNAVILRKDA
jgi:putative membrane protein